MNQRRGADELDDRLVAEITELCDRGDDDVEHGRYDEAIGRYRAALALIPRPIFSWKATAWILTALGETHYFKQDYVAARDAIHDAMRCPGAGGNAFLHLRLGQVEHFLGNRGKAKDELARALIQGNASLFDGEDPIFLDLAKQGLPDPEGT
ncbi:MAG: hypothetical protein U0359_28730 [Byssovorax sp.]